MFKTLNRLFKIDNYSIIPISKIDYECKFDKGGRGPKFYTKVRKLINFEDVF